MVRGERQALIRGRLEVGDGQCLIVHNESGQRYVVVWPAGVTPLGDGRIGVNVPGVGAITVGESFSGSGAYPHTPLEEYDPPVPTECAGRGEEVALIETLDSIEKEK